jgi:hypothetical protein
MPPSSRHGVRTPAGVGIDGRVDVGSNADFRAGGSAQPSAGDHQASSRAVGALTSYDAARHGRSLGKDRGLIPLLNHIDVICYRSETR